MLIENVFNFTDIFSIDQDIFKTLVRVKKYQFEKKSMDTHILYPEKWMFPSIFSYTLGHDFGWRKTKVSKNTKAGIWTKSENFFSLKFLPSLIDCL
jgi:hypothetical protein